MSSATTGFCELYRFIARRDRLRFAIWIGAFAAVFAGSMASMVNLYKTPEDFQTYSAIAASNNALKAMAGPGFGLEHPTLGAIAMNELGLYSHLAVAFLAMSTVIRHTRAEEDTDRAELVRATPVGRTSTFLAASAWAATMVVAIAAVATVSLIAFGLPIDGSLAFGGSATGIGLVFVGVGATTAQVNATARAAMASAGFLLGVSFVIRAVGDVAYQALSWASPLGWAMSIQAFDTNRWPVLAIPLLAMLALMGVALRLLEYRDHGAGLIEQKPGPSRGPAGFHTPLALATRILRPSLVGWAIGLGSMGFFMGLIADQAELFTENEAMAELLSQAGVGSPSDLFISFTLLMLALTASGFSVSSILRMRSEETQGRVELLLAHSVSRSRLLASYAVVSGVGTAAIMIVTGLAAGVGLAIHQRDLAEFVRIVGAATERVPALLVLSGVSILIVGARPRWSAAAWLLPAYAAVVGLFAESLHIPGWARALSPFHHVAQTPAESLSITPLAVLMALAIGTSGAGAYALGRRDINRV